MSQPDPIAKEEPEALEANELVWLIARALQEWDSGDGRIVSTSCDGDNDSAELFINTMDGRCFILRSEDLEEEPA
jgi:hypothetical protein